MPTTAAPNADLGRKAVKSVAKLLLLGLAGVVVAVIGGGFTLYGLVSALAGTSATALVTGAALIAAGSVTVAGCRISGRRVMADNLHHMQELTRQDQQAKLDQERQALAARQATQQMEERKKLDRAAQIEFNAQAATQLKKDVKPMRPLKFAPKPQPQQQALNP